MKRIATPCFLIAVLTSIIALIVFKLDTNNIHDLVDYNTTNAIVCFFMLIVLIISTIIWFLSSKQGKRITSFHIVISAGCFLAWLLCTFKKLSYYSILVDEGFISNATNLYLRIIVYCNLLWGLTLVALSIVGSFIRHKETQHRGRFYVLTKPSECGILTRGDLNAKTSKKTR